MNASLKNHFLRKGFTLTELCLVVVILALVALLAAPKFTGVLGSARKTAAGADMAALRDALLGTGTPSGISPALVPDLEGIPGFSPAQLRLADLLTPTNLIGVAGRWLNDNTSRPHALLVDSDGPHNSNQTYADFAVFTNRDEIAERGWRGPYLRTYRAIENTDSSRTDLFPNPDDRRDSRDRTFQERGFFESGQTYYGIPGEPAIGDPWGNPYVLQVPPASAFARPSETSELDRFRYARIVSAGPNGVLETPCYKIKKQEDKRDNRLAGRTASGTEKRGDDLVLFLLRADIYED